MYNNIDEKIKLLAKIFAWVGIIVSVIFCYIFFNEEEGFVGLLILIFGSLGSWGLSWLIYGFGEMIYKTSEIVRSTRKISHQIAEKEKSKED